MEPKTDFRQSVPAAALIRALGEIALFDRHPNRKAKNLARTIYTAMLDHAQTCGFTGRVELTHLLARGHRGHRTKYLASAATAALGGDGMTHNLFGLITGDYGPVDDILKAWHESKRGANG